MKKYLLPIMALALTFTFVACGDDDDDPAPSNQQQTNQGGQQGGTTTVNYLYSFAKKSYALVDETTVTLSITNAKDGTSVIANEDIKVTLSTVEGTTAEEGTDYEIPTKIVTIPKGKDKVSFTVKANTTEPNSEKNTIVIKPTFAGKNFNPGQYATVKVVLVGSFAKELLGTWVMNELKTTKENVSTMWGASIDEYATWPEFDATDEMTIGATITPAFNSTLKNFFIGEATYEDAGSYTLMGFPPVEMQILKVTGVNRDFSANSTSANNVAYIGVKNIDDGEGGMLLDVYLIDFVPTDFAATAVAWDCYLPNDKGFCATMSDTYVNFTMKKKATE